MGALGGLGGGIPLGSPMSSFIGIPQPSANQMFGGGMRQPSLQGGAPMGFPPAPAAAASDPDSVMLQNLMAEIARLKSEVGES